jgi:hypothetical protein
MPQIASRTRYSNEHIGMRKRTYKKENRPFSLDAVWDFGTIDIFPNLLHQFYRIVIANGPSIVGISAC